MQHLYFISGPCGVGKSTAADALAQTFLKAGRTVCLIHGDDVGDCLLLPEEFSPFTEDGHIRDEALWNRIIGFTWQCILDTARNALAAGADVIIDYVIEEELPLVTALAKETGAAFHYTVLTASREALVRHLAGRGDPETLGRSLFLKEKLEQAKENCRHLLDLSDLSPEQTVHALTDDRFLVAIE